MASTASALRVLVFGPLVALGVAGGMSACGGTSVKHVDGDDGGTGNGASGGAKSGGSGGTGSGGTTDASGGSGGTGGGIVPPLCETVGDYAGADYVDWNVPPETPCGAGETEWCFLPTDPMLQTCIDAGASGAAPAGDTAAVYCPNVRYLCRTQVGCCESIATLVAGPLVKGDPAPAPEPTRCCYLAMPGLRDR